MKAVSDLDVDLVVAQAPEVVVDRLVHALLHTALKLAALRIWNLRLLLSPRWSLSLGASS